MGHLGVFGTLEEWETELPLPFGFDGFHPPSRKPQFQGREGGRKGGSLVSLLKNIDALTHAYIIVLLAFHHAV